MAKSDNFQSPDYYFLDDLLSEEHKLIRKTIRDFVKKEVSPIIEKFVKHANSQMRYFKLGELGCFGPFIPAKYGGQN